MTTPFATFRGIVACATLAATLAACSALPRNPVPAGLAYEAVVPGMPDVRAHAGRPAPAMERDYLLSLRQESPDDFPAGPDGTIRYPHLALSGGGVNGAFGAGFLKGWTETGTRPVFKIVTGVSTGALMAPFAFLGPGHDEALHRFYTTTTSGDVFTERSRMMALMRGDALASTAPLARLIERYVDAALLAQVAQAHRQGRRLYMGTVDLDTRSFVVWNMGMIAGHGDERALALFRKIMLASSSVPIAFPPVLFEVEAGGRRHDEMHVDGFVWANVFLNAGLFQTSTLYERAGRGPAREDIFVIHNGQLTAPPASTPRSLRAVAVRTIDVSARSSIVGDLYREYAFARRGNADFHWITIDERVRLPDLTAFDPSQMDGLYRAGYQAALDGPAWRNRPPGMSGGE
ncbi:patatin-like phospholipase family protein [Pseudoxanthomonas sp. 10H]|uniref:patatin-like phospholipase family protein n=1 Tax=Pseudoxanthomonas sp. 10H TaxID=3242729 RepID=UPI00355690D9